jgi:hypothetical protein
MVTALTVPKITKEQRERLENILNILRMDPDLRLISSEYFEVDCYDEFGNELMFEDVIYNKSLEHVNLNHCCIVGLLGREIGNQTIIGLLESNSEIVEFLDANVLNALSQYYGLSLEQLSELQKINDASYHNLEARKQAVIYYLESILSEQTN